MAGLLCALTAVLVVLGMLLARPLTVILTPGFSGERLDLAVTLLRIMFPGIGFLVLSAWCLGILNSHRRFFLSYVAPVLWNVAQIACAVGVAIAGASEEGIATALAWGVVVGGLLQLLVQLPTVRSLVPDLRLSLDRTSRHVKSVMRRFGTVVVGRGAVQLITYVDLFLASLLAVGAVSALSYAQVLYLLPISLFGMAVAAAELPELSRIGRSGPDAMRERLEVGLERITFYVALAVALYVFAGDVIIGALLQRGEFDAADTRLVWYMLAAFSLGLLGTTRSRLLQNGLYALNRPKLVARIAVLRVALAGLIGALLMFPFDRYAIVGSATERIGDLGFSPAPRLRAAARGRAAAARHRGPGPRRGRVVVGRVPAAPRRARVADRTDRRARPRHPLVADRRRRRGRARRRHPGDHRRPGAAARPRRRGRGEPAMYLGITATMGVTEARAIVDRARRLLRADDSSPVRLAAMFKALRRWWKYLGAKVNSAFNAKADPKIQLEQAITEAQDQHRRLREQAANVIANQKQTEMRLDRALEELEKVSGNAKQAVLMADEAAKKGDTAKVEEFTAAAESFANRLIAIEKEVEDLKALALQSSQASDQAKAAVQQNATALQRKLAERNKLLSQLDQAKMQEQVNKAMASLSETVGEDVPTFDEVREKIEARYAKAKGMSELTESSVESRMLEVEQAAANSEAQTRLAQIRAQLGLAPAAERRTGRRRAPSPPPPSRPPRPRPRPATAAVAAATAARRGRRGGRPRGACPRVAGWCDGRPRRAGPPSRAARGPWRTPGRRGRRSRRRRRSRRSPSPRGPRRAAATRRGRAAPGERRRRRRSCRSTRPRRRSRACGRGGACSSGAPPCRRPARPATAASSTPSREAWAITARTPDQAAILAAASLEAMPPLPRAVPVPPASDSSEWSTSTISSISEADSSSRGSAVRRPGASVSSTSRSAASRWATSAARRSLSPKRISSSAMASFSLTTGTTPRSRSRPRVARACRYCWRIVKSSGREQHLPAHQPVRGRGRSRRRASAGSGPPPTPPAG